MSEKPAGTQAVPTRDDFDACPKCHHRKSSHMSEDGRRAVCFGDDDCQCRAVYETSSASKT